jgi:hypothetical protein
VEHAWPPTELSDDLRCCGAGLGDVMEASMHSDSAADVLSVVNWAGAAERLSQDAVGAPASFCSVDPQLCDVKTSDVD